MVVFILGRTKNEGKERENMKFCEQCGAKIDDQDTICAYCGQELSPKVQKSQEIQYQTTDQTDLAHTSASSMRPMQSTDAASKAANTGFILGLIGIIAWFLPIAGYPVTICGIVYSVKGLKATSNGKAIAGLILSIIFLIATLVNSFLGILLQF